MDETEGNDEWVERGSVSLGGRDRLILEVYMWSEECVCWSGRVCVRSVCVGLGVCVCEECVCWSGRVCV